MTITEARKVAFSVAGKWTDKQRREAMEILREATGPRHRGDMRLADRIAGWIAP